MALLRNVEEDRFRYILASILREKGEKKPLFEGRQRTHIKTNLFWRLFTAHTEQNRTFVLSAIKCSSSWPQTTPVSIHFIIILWYVVYHSNLPMILRSLCYHNYDLLMFPQLIFQFLLLRLMSYESTCHFYFFARMVFVFVRIRQPTLCVNSWFLIRILFYFHSRSRLKSNEAWHGSTYAIIYDGVWT